MGEIATDERTFDVEDVDGGEWYDLLVAYSDPEGNPRRRDCPIEVDDGEGLGADRIESVLADWRRERDDVDTIEGFSVRRVEPRYRGAPAGGDGTTPDLSSGSPRHDAVSEGDRIVYHVDGPDSGVYGYTTEAVVTDTPPIRKQHKEPIEGMVEVDTGTDAKLVPIDWIAGLASAPGIEPDRPNDDL